MLRGCQEPTGKPSIESPASEMEAMWAFPRARFRSEDLGYIGFYTGDVGLSIWGRIGLRKDLGCSA